MDKTRSIDNIELAKLKKEIVTLETQLTELISKKALMEKLIQDYNNKFYSQVGDLLMEVNKLRLEKLEQEALLDPIKKDEFKQAQKENDEFNEHFGEIKSKKVPHLSDKEQEILKRNFHKACQLCHPDIVSDEFKDEATNLFADLKKAYDCNDILKVNQILDLLEKLNYPTKSDKVTNKDRLRLLIDHLRIEIQKVKDEIIEIERSDIYQLITTIGDWDNYIAHIKKQLEHETVLLTRNT